MTRLAILAAALVVLGGCRFKGGESFTSATTPNEPAVAGQTNSDKYGSGGLADATGGLKPKTHYTEGERAGTTDKLDPVLNQPANGSGQQPGENGVGAAPGFGNNNSPASQPKPSDVNNVSARTNH